MGKFVGKFRRDQDNSDDYGYVKDLNKSKKKKNETRELRRLKRLQSEEGEYGYDDRSHAKYVKF